MTLPARGRVMEGSGEDPYLGGLIAAAMVKGYQQNGLLACVKHFALYGASEAGRDYNITDMSRLTMFQHYLPPYTSALTPPVLTFNHSIFPALQYRNHFPVLRRHYKTAQNTGCWRKA